MPRLVLHNICYAQGYTGHVAEYLDVTKQVFVRNRIKKIAQEIALQTPDLVALIEVDLGSLRCENQVDCVSAAAHLPYTFATVKYPRRGTSAVFRFLPILRRQANAILSNTPFNSFSEYMLSSGAKRLVLHTQQVHAKKRYNLLVCHLALGKKTREQQYKELAQLIRTLPDPTIICGDFNCKTTDELVTFATMANLQIALTKNLENTYPSYKPTKQFDCILHSSAIHIKNIKTKGTKLSDHALIVADFEIHASQKILKNVPKNS
jgi:endonuclease/exonuclease/phosphatase family metal-dependent hydrolase